MTLPPADLPKSEGNFGNLESYFFLVVSLVDDLLQSCWVGQPMSNRARRWLSLGAARALWSSICWSVLDTALELELAVGGRRGWSSSDRLLKACGAKSLIRTVAKAVVGTVSQCDDSSEELSARTGGPSSEIYSIEVECDAD